MRAIVILLLVMLMSGCIVHSRGRAPARSTARSRDCPPAYHWEGGACVHNGRAKGHHKR